MNFPFPYQPEQFTRKEKEILLHFFTNIDKPIFAIFNLPQEVVGAMFSRYSRTEKTVRRLFLDEFWGDKELGLTLPDFKLETATQRTQNFYRKVFAEYGDDSVIQMGSVHIAFEYVSNIAAKVIEDARIGAAYIEKSSRYVEFGNEVNGHFLFTEIPEIMTTKLKTQYLAWNKKAFKTYIKHLPTTIKFLRTKYKIEDLDFENPLTGEKVKFPDINDDQEKDKAQKAYERALKAKALDTIRIFLPTPTVTNLGAHYSGQAAEGIINKMLVSPYEEVRVIGQLAYEELKKVIPNFLQNIDNKYGENKREYLDQLEINHVKLAQKYVKEIVDSKKDWDVKIVDWDTDSDVRIVAQIIFAHEKNPRRSKEDILKWARKVKAKNPQLLTEIVEKSIATRLGDGKNRRHKLSRAFEHAFSEIEFNIDWGVYRDLQRNRLSTTVRQLLSPAELFIPQEFTEPGMENVLSDYKQLAKETKDLYRQFLKLSKNYYAAEYITLFGNKVRFSVRANIRQWVFFSELRTIEGGHPSYRVAMQEAVKQIISKMPYLKPVFTHVNWVKDYGLGRLKAEVKTQEKLARIEQK